ncbi:MAG: OprO/OprP family phosphate-selective porin [Pseudomarimonas sp.]
MLHRSLLTSAVLAALTLSPQTNAAEQADVAALAERLRLLEQRLGIDSTASTAGEGLAQLDQRLAIIERKLDIASEEAAAKALTTPAVSIGEKGLAVKTPAGDFDLKLRGTVQFDQRNFFSDDQQSFNDTHLFRRVRPSLEGTLGPLLAYRITPEFAGDGATLIDAYIDVRFDPRYTLRVGKLKGPVGLERLQSASALSMIERGFPTELAPNRDIGAQLQGELAAGTINYALGLFNGAPDGRDSPTADADNHFEWAGRIFFEPWKNEANALSGLGFGVSASVGDKEGTGNNFLPRYRTPGQNQFFGYRTTVFADGEHTRLSPQAYYYRTRFGLLAEYIRSEQELLIGTNETTRTELQHDAWQLTASWVLTGEDASYRGIAKPNQSYVIGGEGWGAFEIVGRYGELDVDDDAFPLYADANTAATGASAWGLGLNWYLTPNLKLAFNHTNASFDGGAAGGRDRPDEKTFFSRVQVAF